MILDETLKPDGGQHGNVRSRIEVEETPIEELMMLEVGFAECGHVVQWSGYMPDAEGF